MMIRATMIASALLLGACAAGDGIDEDVAAARAISMSGPKLSWSELGVPASLQARACGVYTLVNGSGQAVGYCTRGQQCRTMDWRPVEDGCNNFARGRPQPAPAVPSPQPAPAGGSRLLATGP
jgi:hypothetical protein